MSDMKFNALVNAGITIHNRHDIPDYLVPPDSAVEVCVYLKGQFSDYFTRGFNILSLMNCRYKQRSTQVTFRAKAQSLQRN